MNIPTQNQNPGDIKNPQTGQILSFNSLPEGQAALYNDLTSKMTGTSKTGLNGNSNLVDFSKVYAPASDNNDPLQYAANLANKLGVSPDTKIGTLMPRIDDFANAISSNEGYQTQTSTQNAPQVANIANNSTQNTYGATNPAGINDTLAQGIMKGIENIPSSTLNLGKGLWSAISHPIKTVEGLGNVALGGVESGFGAITRNTPKNTQTEDWGSFINNLKSRYGSLNNIRQTLENDPVGAAIDIASIVVPAGEGLKGIGEVSDIGKLVSTGEKISEIGQTINPINATIGGANKIGEAIGNTLEKTSEGAWGGILKPTPIMLRQNPDLLSDISKQGITAFTKQGLSDKFGEQMSNIGSQIDNAVKNSMGQISTENIVQRLAPLRNTYANIPGQEGAVNKIDGIINDTLDKGDFLSNQQAQTLKISLNNVLKGNDYTSAIYQSPAERQAYRALQSGIKQELENNIPEIKDLNNRYGIFKVAKQAIDKTIERTTGKGIAGTGIGMYDLLSGIAGGQLGGFSGALKAIGLEKFATSPMTLSIISSGAQKLLNLMDKMTISQKLALYSTIISEIQTKINQPLNAPKSVFNH